MVTEIDQIGLWYVTSQSNLRNDDHTLKDLPEAINLVEDDVVLVSDMEEAEGPASEEDNSLEPPMDLNKGRPDYRTMWVAAACFKNRGDMFCSPGNLCGRSHYCLRCRAEETTSEYNQWDMTDQRVASHLIHHVNQKLWKLLSTDKIWDFLMDLDVNLKGNQALQELSRYGALRISEDVSTRSQSGKFEDV
jgi:hypothetical protein